MYKNPIPCLSEDQKYKEFVIKFRYKDAMTTKEAASEFFAYLMDVGKLPEEFVLPNSKPVIEYQK